MYMSSFQNKTGTQSMNGIINITDGLLSIEDGVITYNDGTTQNTAFSPAILAQVNANTIKLTNVTFNLGTTTITGSLIIPNNSVIQAFVNNGYMDLSTSQSIGGLKSFSSLISANNGLSVLGSISFPNNSIIQSFILNGYIDLLTTQSVAGLKTFSSLITANSGLTVLGSLSIPNNSVIQAFVNNGYIDLSSSQSINGSKSFNSLLSTQGITNTAYQSIFGTSTVTCANTDNSKFFYCGSFALIQLIILPLNPIVGATFTFYNAGTFDVHIRANTGNGFESANQLMNIGGTPPSVLLLRGANLTLYFRGSWVAIAGSSSLRANLSTTNTFVEANTFTQPIILPSASIQDTYLSSNVALKNTLNTFSNLQIFSNGIFPSSINVGTGGTTVFIDGNTGAGSFNSITNSTSITTNTLDATSTLSLGGININTIFVDRTNNQVINGVKDFQTNPVFNSGAILDTYLTSNIPKKNSNNTFQGTQTFDVLNSTGGILENGININQIYQPIVPAPTLIFVNTTLDQVINGVKDFQTNPVFNSGAILDTYLTSNIPKKNSNNTFQATQTFDVINATGGILQNGVNINLIYEPFGTFINFVDLTSNQIINGFKTFNDRITSNGVLNTAYQAPFGVPSVTLNQNNTSQLIYCGSFAGIQTIILPTNPIVGTTFTFTNAGTFKVLIQAGTGNGFETANQLIRNAGPPQSADLLQGAMLTLYFRGSWIALSGSSSLIAGLAVANTFSQINNFTQPIVLPINSINDSYLSTNIAKLNGDGDFLGRNIFYDDVSFIDALVRFGQSGLPTALTIDVGGDVITSGDITSINIFCEDITTNNSITSDNITSNNLTTDALTAETLTLPSNSILDGYLSLNIPKLDIANIFGERNSFDADVYFYSTVRYGVDFSNPALTIDTGGNCIANGKIECNNAIVANGITSSRFKTYSNTLTSSTAGLNDITNVGIAYTFVVPNTDNFSQNITVNSPITINIVPLGATLSNFNVTLTNIVFTVRLNGTVIITETKAYGIVKSISCNSLTLSMEQYYVLASFTFPVSQGGTYTVFFSPTISSSPHLNQAIINSTTSGSSFSGSGAVASFNSANGSPYASQSFSLSNAIETLINTVGVNHLNASGNISSVGFTASSNFQYVSPRVAYPSLHQIGFQTEAGFTTNIFVSSNQYTDPVALLNGVYMFQINQVFNNTGSVATLITKNSVGITLSVPSSGSIPFLTTARNISFAYSIPNAEIYETSCVFILQTTATNYYAGGITTGSNGTSTSRNTSLRITRIA